MSRKNSCTSHSESDVIQFCSEEEQKLTVELYQRMSSLIHEQENYVQDKFYLLFWLRSRKMRLQGAEAAIKSTLNWRWENKLKHSTMEEFPRETLEMLPMDGNSVDKYGVPVLQLSTGRWDVRGYIERYGRDGFVSLMAQSTMNGEKIMIDYNRRLNQKNPGKITTQGLVVVVNCADFTFKQFSYLPATWAALESVQAYDRYFPKIVDKFFFINVNRVALTLMKMILPFLGVPDVEMYGCNPEVWKPKLLARIDESQLLTTFGGTKIIGKE